MTRSLRRAAWIAFLAGATLLLLVLAIRVYDHVYRVHAERLIADAEKLQLGASMSEVQGGMSKWPNLKRYPNACNSEQCTLAYESIGSWPFKHRWFPVRIYVLLRGHAPDVFAQFNFVRGRLQQRTIRVAAWGGRSFLPDADVVAYLSLRYQLGASGRLSLDLTHEDFAVIHRNCTGCVAGEIAVTPYFKTHQPMQVPSVDLRCIDTFAGCPSLANLLPLWPSRESGGEPDYTARCRYSARVFGRELGVLGVVKLIGVHEVPKDGFVATVADVAMERSFTPQLKQGAPYKLVLQSNEYVEGLGCPGRKLIPGQRLLLSGDAALNALPEIYITAGDVRPENPDERAKLLQGIEEGHNAELPGGEY